MSNTKHTKGPWALKTNQRSFSILIEPEVSLKIANINSSSEANAQLVASAPDLLEALENLTAALVSGPEHVTECHADALEAIAKAKGES